MSAVFNRLSISTTYAIFYLIYCGQYQALLTQKRFIKTHAKCSSRFGYESFSTAEFLWSDALIPTGYDEVEKEMLSSLSIVLDQTKPDEERQIAKLLSVDVLTPGLNPKLEQKAYLPKESLFDLVYALLPVLNNRFSKVKLMFPSAGDAAGFQRHCYRNYYTVPETVEITDLSLKRMVATDKCCLFVTAKNHLGDPVVDEVERIALAYPTVTAILLNCDLSDRVTSGMQTKNARNAFRSLIEPAYYFRNVVQISRPSLEPLELGAIRFSYSNRGGNVDSNTPVFQLFAAERGERMRGPGSLNRFMKLATLRRNPNDATSESPPLFLLVSSFPAYPNREQIDEAMTKASGAVSRLARERERSTGQPRTYTQAQPADKNLIKKGETVTIATLEDALALLRESALYR